MPRGGMGGPLAPPILHGAGAAWRYEGWPEPQAEILLRLWTDGFVPTVPVAPAAAPLRLVYDRSLACPADAEARLVAPGRVQVRSTGSDWWLQAPDMLARIPADRSAVYLRLEPGFSGQALKSRQTALLLPMLWLLQAAGRVVLHAAAVQDPRSGSALLLAGGSGSGKSTTLATLCQAGWHLLADDVSVCWIDGAMAQVWPLARGLSLGSQAPVDAVGWSKLDARPCEGKSLLEPPLVADRSAPIAAIVLPCVTAAAGSTTRRLGTAEGIAGLLPVTGGVMLEPGLVKGSLDAVGWLAANIAVHELRLGRDSYRCAARLGELLQPLLCRRAPPVPA